MLLSACAGGIARNALPEAQVDSALLLIDPLGEDDNLRFWGDQAPPHFGALIDAPTDVVKQHFSAIYGKRHSYLALSGGGENGAFGAGLLNGWTETGTRPEFTMVTGISTGSLIAPFAFLGPEYDPVLKEIYTTLSTKDLVRKRSVFGILPNASAADTSPLRAKIAQYVDEEIVSEIATAHREGRRLYIGTTNLDAGRPVLWNIGAIANSSDPAKIDLIHDVLLASASIPGAFPPVFINVKADGEQYDEMHVDGGTTQQVFLYPAGVDWRTVERKLDVVGRPDVYVIRNASPTTDYQETKGGLVSIAGRSIFTLIRTQGIGDMYEIYLNAIRDGLNYNLAYIPADFNMKSTEPFDLNYMNKLYELGYQEALSGNAWNSVPPGYAQ